MESVKLIGNKNFVNRWSGAVTKGRPFFVPENVAEELVALGVAKYPESNVAAEAVDPKKSNPSPALGGDGMEKQSASLPAATASRKPKSTTPKSKTGK
jgi:hypothetical protein